MNIDETLDRLNASYLEEAEKKPIVDWLKENTPMLVNLSAIEVRNLLIAVNNGKKASMKYYSQMIEKMDWAERIQLLELSAADLRKSKNPQLNLAAIFIAASEVAIKLLPILIAII